MIAEAEHVAEVLHLKHGDAPAGATPRLDARFGYVSPDAWYEGTLLRLIGPGTVWLDVGGGRHVFPNNYAAAALLAHRCAMLVGVDPSANILNNPHVYVREQCPIEAFSSSRVFDVASLRMVAEHIASPEAAVASIGRLVRPGGHAVVYTVWRFAPLSMLGGLLPDATHVWAMRSVFGGERRDVHPAYYRMNTRATLKRLFEGAGFSEVGFRRLDDCRLSNRLPWLHRIELMIWRALRALRLPYPEACLLAVYQRRTPDA